MAAGKEASRRLSGHRYAIVGSGLAGIELWGVVRLQPISRRRAAQRAGYPAQCIVQTQGKIERWHQTLKNRILLENYYLPGDLEAHVRRFVDHYNHCRYHESLQNITPADAYFGRGQTILLQRERIKRDTIKQRRLQHQLKAA